MANLNVSDRQAMVKAVELAFDELSTGSKIPEDRAAEFVVKVREKAMMREHVDVVPINASGKILIPSLEAANQVLGVPQGLQNPADYSFAWFNDGDETIETFDTEAIIFVENRWVEANIQGQSGLDIALDLLTERFAANAEETGFYSNVSAAPAVLESEVKKTGSGSQYVKFDVRARANGWLEQMESGLVVDAENSDDLIAVLGEALLAWPERYESYMDMVRWFMPPRVKKVMTINLSRKETSLGDLAQNGKVNLMPLGIEPLAVPLLASRPPETQHITLTGTTPVALQYKPLRASEIVVLPSTLAGTATTPYVQGAGNDYIVNESNGTIARDSASTISSGATVKVQYKTGTKIFKTFPKNLVMGLTKDISIEPWGYPLANGRFFIIRAKMGYGFRNKGANILIKNIKADPQSV